MRKWIIEEAHNSNWLVECEYDSREEAEYNLKEIEECDKRNGEYEPEQLPCKAPQILIRIGSSNTGPGGISRQEGQGKQ